MLTSTAARWPSDSPPGTRSSACPPPLDPGHHAATSWARTAPLTPKPRQPDSAVDELFGTHTLFESRRPCTTQQPPYWAAGPRISPLFLSLLSANATAADSVF